MNRFLVVPRLVCVVLSLLGSAGLLSACGADHDDPRPDAEADTDADAASVSMTVGATGGIVDGPDGTRLAIPAGALTEDTTITVRRSAVGAPDASFADRTTGAIYELTPHGLQFARSVTVSIPAAEPTAIIMAEVGEGWHGVNAVFADGRASWQVTSFSWLTGLACAVPVGNLDPYPCGVPQTMATLTSSPAAAFDGYTLSAAAAITAHYVYRSAPDCVGHVTVTRGLASGTHTVIFDSQVPMNAIADLPNRAGGTLDLQLPYTHADVGLQSLDFAFSCPRPVYNPPPSVNVAGSVWDGVMRDTLLLRVTIPEPPQPPTVPQARVVLAARKVAAGGGTHCAVRQDGGVACWGTNTRGQCGRVDDDALDGDAANDGFIALPSTISGVANAVAVGVGEAAVCAAASSGSVVCWGGLPGGDSLTAVTIADISDAIDVSLVGVDDGTTAFDVGCALLTDATVRCFALHPDVATTAYVGRPSVMSGSSMLGIAQLEGACGVTSQDTVACWSPLALFTDPSQAPEQFLDVVDPVFASGTGRYGCAATATGAVRCWGVNYRTGNGNGIGVGIPASGHSALVSGVTTAQAVTVAADATCMLLGDQSVSCWSDPATSLGLGAITPPGSETPVSVPAYVSVTALDEGSEHCALQADGTILGFGYASGTDTGGLYAYSPLPTAAGAVFWHP